MASSQEIASLQLKGVLSNRLNDTLTSYSQHVWAGGQVKWHPVPPNAERTFSQNSLGVVGSSCHAAIVYEFTIPTKNPLYLVIAWDHSIRYDKALTRIYTKDEIDMEKIAKELADSGNSSNDTKNGIRAEFSIPSEGESKAKIEYIH